MIAKFDGTCQRCGDPVTRGEKIGWSDKAGAMHPKCFAQEMEAQLNSGEARQPWMFTDEDPVFRMARARLGCPAQEER